MKGKITDFIGTAFLLGCWILSILIIIGGLIGGIAYLWKIILN